jgi:hypothetical protein
MTHDPVRELAERILLLTNDRVDMDSPVAREAVALVTAALENERSKLLEPSPCGRAGHWMVDWVPESHITADEHECIYAECQQAHCIACDSEQTEYFKGLEAGRAEAIRPYLETLKQINAVIATTAATQIEAESQARKGGSE